MDPGHGVRPVKKQMAASISRTPSPARASAASGEAGEAGLAKTSRQASNAPSASSQARVLKK